jgi:methyl-accepting chemotaxis protein
MPLHARGYTSRIRLRTTVAVMIGSAVCISAAIIVYFDTLFPNKDMAFMSNKLELAAVTLMPYMISAVVAAITAIGLMALWPSVRAVSPSEKIIDRLRELSAGNLASKVNLRGATQLGEIAVELNRAVEALNRQVAQLKVINRQQWDVLCEIRTAAERSNCTSVLRAVETMEKNWEKLAALEAELST